MRSLWWRVTLFMGAALVLNEKLPAHMAVAGVSPDLALAGLFLVTLREGAVAGAWTGFASGLFIDVATPEMLGARALSLSVSAFFLGRISEHVDLGSRVVLSILLVLMGIADAVVLEFARHLSDPGGALERILVHHLPSIGYTVVIVLVMLAAFGRRLVPAHAGWRRSL